MGEQDRRLEYLRKAKEADQEAEKAKIPAEKRSWEEIAESYRALAKTYPSGS